MSGTHCESFWLSETYLGYLFISIHLSVLCMCACTHTYTHTHTIQYMIKELNALVYPLKKLSKYVLNICLMSCTVACTGLIVIYYVDEDFNIKLNTNSEELSVLQVTFIFKFPWLSLTHFDRDNFKQIRTVGSAGLFRYSDELKLKSCQVLSWLSLK